MGVNKLSVGEPGWAAPCAAEGLGLVRTEEGTA